MFKLFRNIGFRITVNIIISLAGGWFYLSLQEPTTLNKILFGMFYLPLLGALCIDIKIAIERFLATPAK